MVLKTFPTKVEPAAVTTRHGLMCFLESSIGMRNDVPEYRTARNYLT